MRQGFEISINDYDRELYTTFKTVLEQREGESSVHVLLKVVAASIFFENGIRIEPTGIDQQYKPDLVTLDLTARPVLWVECGQVTTTKLDKLSSRYPDTKIVVVKRYPREVENLYERVEKDVRRPYNISYVSFDPEFIDGAANHISGKNVCVAIKSDKEFQFIVNERHFTTALHTKSHPAPKYRGKRSP